MAATEKLPLEFPSAVSVRGLDLPVDIELSRIVAAAPASVNRACPHTRQTIKRGDVFVVSHADGGIYPGCECGQGIYHQDTRFLSAMTLELAGRAPITLAATAEHNFFSRVEAMNESWLTSEGQTIRRETMHLSRTRLVDGAVTESICVTNFNPHAVRATLALELRADFKDIFEVRGFPAKQLPGTFLRPRLEAGGAELLYRGADDILRHTVLAFSQPPDRLTARSWSETHETGLVAEWDLTWSGQGDSWELAIAIQPSVEGENAEAVTAQAVSEQRLTDLHAATHAPFTRITSSHEGFDTFVNRGIADILMLASPSPDGAFVSAGIPWFACPFGRDSLLTAYQTLPLGPEMAIATLRFLARHQGEKVDLFRDEEPGKILHEMRKGELSNLGEVPFSCYYGTIDATPLWLVLLSETYRWTGDIGLVRDMWPHARRALTWLDTYGDADGDNFVEYVRKGDKGLSNQGWKDSHDSIVHADGRFAEAPIALAEVQGYVYDAKRRMSELALVMGDSALAQALGDQAHTMATRFHAAFWVEDGGYYALALDGEKAQVRTQTTNPGHCLWSGLIPDAYTARVATSMVAPDMFNGWGLRTMSASSPNYNPLSYHNGSVWPHDSALVAKGMADRGFKAEAHQVLAGLYQTSRHYELGRLPELFCGFAALGNFAKPVPYPVACSPQAWAAGTPLLLLQAVLGLEADAPTRTLTIRQPTLPAWVPEVKLEGLRLGDGQVDLVFRQADGVTYCEVLAATRGIHVHVLQ